MNRRASHSLEAVIGFTLLNVPTVVMAGLWFLLIFFVTAIGSKPPTAAQYMEMLWPVFAGIACVCLSLFFAFLVSRIIGTLLGMAGMMVMPFAFDTMFR